MRLVWLGRKLLQQLALFPIDSLVGGSRDRERDTILEALTGSISAEILHEP
jgi:hypothetical protein